MDLAQTIALSMGVAWASGLNMYAAIGMLGLLGVTGHIDLPPDLQPLTHPMVIGTAVVMYCVEFFADKIPGVDSGWDAVHTFLRVPAGAVLAAGALGDVSLPAQIAAGLVGGSLTAATHATKAGGRVLINTSPEPVSNWTASVGEDAAVFAGLWAALNYPIVFLVALASFVGFMIWVLPRLWRGVQTVANMIRRWFGRDDGEGMSAPPPPTVPGKPLGGSGQ